MKIIKAILKWAFLACILLLIVILALWFLNAPKTLAENTESKARLDQALYAVDSIDLEFTDTTRVTPAMGGFEGDDKRVLNGEIWFPRGDVSQRPLIVYSHGFGGYYNESEHITEFLASQGYVVASVNFPLSNRRSPTKVPQLLDVVNQPGDVSAVIDKVLALNSDPSNVMYERVDANKIGATGLSLGGLTTALVSFHPDLKDERIKVAAMMAPPLETFSQQFYTSNPRIKSLVISGSFDRVVPEAANATNVQPRNLNGWFMSFDKGTHLGFANLGNPIRWMENPDNLGCIFMSRALPKLDLPDRWNAVIPNTDGVVRDVAVGSPCPDLPGKSMNGLKQQWLTRIAVGSFFDMHLTTGANAESAIEFFNATLSSENPEVSLTLPRR